MAPMDSPFILMGWNKTKKSPEKRQPSGPARNGMGWEWIRSGT